MICKTHPWAATAGHIVNSGFNIRSTQCNTHPYTHPPKQGPHSAQFRLSGPCLGHVGVRGQGCTGGGSTGLYETWDLQSCCGKDS